MPRTPLEIALIPLGMLLKNKRAGDNASVRHRIELATDRPIQLTSSSFEPQGIIPDIHSAIGRGKNTPALAWSTVPDGTVQLLLIMEDVDIPLKAPGIHLVALFSSAITSLREDALAGENAELRFIPDRRGRLGYGGPSPLPGHGPHRYHFHLYALDRTIPVTSKMNSISAVLRHVDGRVIAGGHLTGTQQA